ncbi:MAG: helix-turn-helix domain-containing protein [Streptosporangiaceae bacterium]|nr:helix-turn-helix domain-containing protein [Streptosporangiaceae bacterium]
MGTVSEARRTELAAFLRSRRERISPEDVGLPAGQRRRTAGLRREEVAQLAGVGVTWYTWLEQGRPIHASVQVLDAVAKTLQLDAVERQHLFRLAEVPEGAVPDGGCLQLRPEVQQILDQLNPMPANVVSERFDIAAWNQAYAALFPRTPDLPVSERNTLLQCFTVPECCRAFQNSEEQRAAMVAHLRAAYGHHVGDPAWTAFIKRMEAASPEFARMWATQDVAYPASYTKVFRHPLHDKLLMTSTSLSVQGCPGARMVIYTPADAGTRQAMEMIMTECTRSGVHFPCWEQHRARERELAMT